MITKYRGDHFIPRNPNSRTVDSRGKERGEVHETARAIFGRSRAILAYTHCCCRTKIIVYFQKPRLCSITLSRRSVAHRGPKVTYTNETRRSTECLHMPAALCFLPFRAYICCAKMHRLTHNMSHIELRNDDLLSLKLWKRFPAFKTLIKKHVRLRPGIDRTTTTINHLFHIGSRLSA